MAVLASSTGSGRRAKIVTLDIDFPLLKRAQNRGQSDLVCGDGTSLPFADDTFDAVVLVHALEHIPQSIRDVLAREIARVSRRGVVIHGPAGPGAEELSHRFIAALVSRGIPVPRYAHEHLKMGLPQPEWFTRLFPGCELTPCRNLDVEFAIIMTEHTPVARWFAGYRNGRLVDADTRPPFVEYTMIWRKQPGPAEATPGIGRR
jgi:SAM-dependent methyltransferase